MLFFRRKIFDVFKGHFGLDLSDLSVRIVEVNRTDHGDTITSYGQSLIPVHSIRDGEIIDKDNVVLAIKKVVKEARPVKLSTNKVICSLPEIKSFLRIINIPKMKEEEIGEAIKWEMEANIPMSIDDVYYDWQSLSSKAFGAQKGQISVLVVAVSKKIIDLFIEVLEEAGLDVVAFEIESLAQARSLLSSKDDKQTNMVIDVGDKRMSMLISLGLVPSFTSSIPLSASSMTDAISKKMNVAFDVAERIKVMHGIGSYTQNDSLFQAMQPVLENMVIEIEKSIDFYSTGLKYSSDVDNIILCGGGSNTKGIIPYFSKRLGRKISIGNPWINLNLAKIPPIEKQKSVQYSAAIGLALKDNLLG